MPDIKEIYARFLARKCSDKEVSILLDYFRDKDNAEELLEWMQADMDAGSDTDIDQLDILASDRNWVALTARRQQKIRSRRIMRLAISVAASVFLICMGAVLYYYTNSGKSNPALVTEVEQIIPGSNKAIITFSDGNSVDLSDGKEGVVVGEELAYEDGTSIAVAETPYATLTTPRGGQYRITLPDGTKVWLNAASSLHYPTRFDADVRRVELTGEAYFEVAHNALKPFVVYSAEQRTVVKGTKFNLSAYPDDKAIETTLLEGAVAVQFVSESLTEELLLKPDQQSTMKEGGVSRRQVDAREAMAWSQGKFMFTDAPLPRIMSQIARWYDVEVTYLQAVDGVTFTGSISRFEDIKDVLRKLALTGRIHFDMEERRIVVKRA